MTARMINKVLVLSWCRIEPALDCVQLTTCRVYALHVKGTAFLWHQVNFTKCLSCVRRCTLVWETAMQQCSDQQLFLGKRELKPTGYKVHWVAGHEVA